MKPLPAPTPQAAELVDLYLYEPTNPKVDRFLPVAIGDVELAVGVPYLVEGLLPLRGLACVVDLPKSRKSYFMQHLLCTAARGVPYDNRPTLGGPVLQLTGKGVTGFKHRLVAMRRHEGIEGQGVPFYMIDNVPDLGSQAFASLMRRSAR
jgi:hypothetical protein